MFSKRVITSLVALGLFATTISPAFAQDAQTGTADGAATNTSTDTTGSAATDTSTTGTTNTDASTTGTNSTDSGTSVGTDTGTSVDTATADKETKKEKPGKKNKLVKKDKKNKTKDAVEAKKVDLVCMQTAVEKRDNAIIAALDTSYMNVKTALTARRDALKAAWGIEDKKARAEAVKKAWKDFQGTWKKEKKALNEARKTAWKQFKEGKRACGGEGEGEGESEGGDIKL